MIDKNIKITAGFVKCWMTVKQARDILQDKRFEDDDQIMPNKFGNLFIFRNEGQQSLGYIDFETEQFILAKKKRPNDCCNIEENLKVYMDDPKVKVEECKICGCKHRTFFADLSEIKTKIT